MRAATPNQQLGPARADPSRWSKRLSNTWLGRFYSRRLKRFRLAQLIVSWVWRKGLLAYKLIWIYRNTERYPLVPLSVYTSADPKLEVADAETVTAVTPTVYPKSRAGRIGRIQPGYRFPRIYVARLRDALVTGGTNLVVANGFAVCHDLYDFRRDYTSEELNGRTYVWPRRQSITWLMPTAAEHRLKKAACFTDACARNYAHWMTEVLPRIHLYCANERSHDVPLIVDNGLHQNLIESLSTVAGAQHETITLPVSTSLRVDELFLTSVAGYIPFQRRSAWHGGGSQGAFSPSALRSLRRCIQERLGSGTCPVVRRIYVRRNSNTRNIINADEMEELLVSRGFAVVEPERLTFGEQVALFSNADIVVGATGAALANLIFCRPSTKIVILISDFKYMPYWYWQNMAAAVGNEVIYVLGSCASAAPHLHSDFRVDRCDMIGAIDSATTKT
jgi:capsular polysaccharide biosynthesis protein